jgi:hypothetical protein
LGRGAGGLGLGLPGDGSGGINFKDSSLDDASRTGVQCLLRIGPLRGIRGATAIVTAGIRALNRELRGTYGRRFRRHAVARMRGFADAAGGRRSSRCQRQRSEASHKREEQQESGGQAAHLDGEFTFASKSQNRTWERVGASSELGFLCDLCGLFCAFHGYKHWRRSSYKPLTAEFAEKMPQRARRKAGACSEISRYCLCLAAHLGPPPADTDEEEAPVL